MSMEKRIEKLESYNQPPTGSAYVALLRPSEILAMCEEAIQNGYQPTAEELARIEALRREYRHEQP